MLRVFRALAAVAALGWAVPVPLGASGLQGPARVIDGDTLDIGGIRLRLQGIDAPERGQRCQDGAGGVWACGDWSGRALREALRGARLVCHDLGERTHGRIVARCDLDGRDLGALLVETGVVRACPRYAARHPHSRGYEQLESRAIARRVGLHAGTTPPLAGFCTDRSAAAVAVPASGCTIKGNISRGGERIYHLPDQRHYAATRIDPSRGERWFCSEAEARDAGWRRARR